MGADDRETDRAPACFAERSNSMTRIQSSYQAQLRSLAAQLRIEADTIPCGRARDGLLRQAEKLESSAVVEGWISSSELQPPMEKSNDTSYDESKLDARAH
jgi:hypothetical protein